MSEAMAESSITIIHKQNREEVIESREFVFEGGIFQTTTHHSTSLIINSDGQWLSVSKIKARNFNTTREVSVSVSFSSKSFTTLNTNNEIESEWGEVLLWKKNFKPGQERIVRNQGVSQFIANYFHIICSDGKAQMKIKSRRKRGWLGIF